MTKVRIEDLGKAMQGMKENYNHNNAQVVQKVGNLNHTLDMLMDLMGIKFAP